MAPRVFVTGVTGYIAGDALAVIATEHPDYEYALLVRNEEKAAQVTARFPKARIVLGSLDDSELLKAESAAADIVIHAADASDHVGAAHAIADGLVSGHSKERPGYWLHTGGTGILTFADSRAKTFGEPTDKVYDDMDGVHELTHLPDDAFHRNVDAIVLECGARHADIVKTVIVCPPTIYGVGRGPCSTRGRQAYELARVVLTKKLAPVVGAGKSRWNNVHVHDLSAVYALLVDAAAKGSMDPALWGEQGYILTENGEHSWAELATRIAAHAAERGLIPPVEGPSPLSYDEAIELAGFEAASWGMNSRGRAERARQVLGWRPRKGSLEAEIPAIVDAEARRLGMVKG